MKIEKQDNNLIVFFNEKTAPKNINKIELEKYFQKMFNKLNNIYNLDLNGNYEINIYKNKYGVILEIKKEEIEYFDYYDTIDMHLNISKYNDILYKTTNIIKDTNIYAYKGEIYIEPIEIEFNKLGQIIENSEIIYGEKAYNIKKRGKKLNTKDLKVENLI